MPKRKFHEVSKSTALPADNLTSSEHRQQQRLLGYLENGQAQLLGALKLARGFERQKLGRRHKDARSKVERKDDNKEVERIDAEIAALKALDLNAAAEFYIARTLCRIKTIASSPGLPPKVRSLGQGRSPYQTPANINVTSRLFKSTAVKNSMESIEEQARGLLSVQRHDGQQNRHNVALSRVKPATDEPDIPDEPDEVWQGVSDSSHDDPSIIQTLSMNEILDKGDFADSDSMSSALDGTNSNDDPDSDADRLASNSDTESASHQRGTLNGFYRVVPDGIDNDHDNVSVSLSPRRPQVVTTKSEQINPFETRPNITTKTTFLPTLASGYVSGSDSDPPGWNDDEDTKKPKRRNRMGQQARRVLAERQYGAEAKHLKDKKGRNNKGRTARDFGWDLKKGAVDGRGRGRSGRGGFMTDAGVTQRADHEKRKPDLRTRDDTGRLHPSWIAKKKLKEQQNSGAEKFQGKKVVFD